MTVLQGPPQPPIDREAKERRAVTGREHGQEPSEVTITLTEDTARWLFAYVGGRPWGEAESGEAYVKLGRALHGPAFTESSSPDREGAE